MIQCGWAQDTASDGNPGCVSLQFNMGSCGFTCPSIQEKKQKTRETYWNIIFSNFLFLFFSFFFRWKNEEKTSTLGSRWCRWPNTDLHRSAWSGWADRSRKPVTWIEVLPRAPFPKQINKTGHGPTEKVGVSNHLIYPRYPKYLILSNPTCSYLILFLST